MEDGIVKIDDISPQIIYGPEGTWKAPTLANDGGGALMSYMDSTFHMTTGEGSYATLLFNGSAVTAFGALRGNHGVYQVFLDGKLVNETLGAGNDLYQQVLWKGEGLGLSHHNLTLVNRPSLTNLSLLPDPGGWIYLDIDFFLVNPAGPLMTGSIVTTQHDDGDSAFKYSGSGWSTQQSDMNQGGGFRQSSTPGDSVSLSFFGPRVQIFGNLGWQYATYSVSIDGGEQTTYIGNASQLYSKVPLFTAAMLGNTSHTITLTNVAADSPGNLAIDYAVVNYTLDSASEASASSAYSLPVIPSVVIDPSVVTSDFQPEPSSRTSHISLGSSLRSTSTSAPHLVSTSQIPGPSIEAGNSQSSASLATQHPAVIWSPIVAAIIVSGLLLALWIWTKRRREG
ncbi:hypothetical protein BD324DRAFT_647536 [Kockovaella imperatae]|uniref:Uncharacterized protein n=1 Tax=Kockovaella imperatae TaxID=4999 RepID=A0A1Y1USW0_9TREE|nr:hypothetical protein BD324DRAFT_647536 [Kockovaella imperatae]ORX40614.1 hypothetical protein BD324DRAFT_647536 [Kockovaella imperatae]